MGDYILEMRGISKSFPGVKAVDQVDLVLERGEVLGLLGENGAGKSTLIKIISGVQAQDEGTILIEGKEQSRYTPMEGIELGISVIYQELNYMNSVSVAENIFLGRLPKTKWGRIDYKKLEAESRKIQQMVGLGDVNPFDDAGVLTVAQKQLMEIARAFARNAKIIIMDEPTSALNEKEVELLYRIIREFAEKGGAVIFISHKLEEVFDITDSVMVMRDGKFINRWKTKEIDKHALIAAMVGRELNDMYPMKSRRMGEIIVEVSGMCTEFLKDISFSVRAGEIVGLYGLMGAGCEEITQCIYGVRPMKAGSLKMFGKEVKISSPDEGLKAGIAFVPSERKSQGLVLNQSVRHNITLATLHSIKDNGILNLKKEAAVTEKWIQKLKIKTSDIEACVDSLSGGNQQKVVLAKTLNAAPQLLILNEPTRGVDVGAKVEIYKLMEQLCEEGLGILMVSSEMPETMAIADRILAISDGKLIREFTKAEVNQLDLMKAAMGE